MALDAAKLIFEWEKDETNDFYVKPGEFEFEVVKGYKNPVKKVDGIYIFNDAINVTSIKNIKLRPSDAFIIGFPKSGTTWIEELVWLIRNDFNYTQAETLFHFARVPWVDRGFSQLVFEEETLPRTFKSHVPFRFLPDNFNKIAKVVYVVRNPKDVVVSLHNFLKSMLMNEFVGSLDDLVDLFCKGKTVFGPWWEHLNQYENLEGIHIIHYEDILENPFEKTKELGKYLGHDLTDKELNELLAFTAFDNMKNFPSMDFKSFEFMFKNDMNFFYKGQIGNWKSHLTEEQSQKIDEMVRTKLTYKKPLQYEPSKNN